MVVPYQQADPIAVGRILARAPAFARQYRRPGLDEIYLGFAGCYPVRHPVHRAIAALSPGDPLTARVEKSGR